MENLRKAIIAAGLDGSDETLAKFQAYMGGILKWNEKVNLTRITDPDEFVVKHFIDSIACCGYEEFKTAKKIIDVGTGAGFPGVPLAIVSPDKHYVLADSLNKRLKIVSELCEMSNIANTEVVHGRAEELAMNKLYRQQFDLCVSRAVANTAVLAEYCLPFIKVGGYLMAYKGPDAEAEVAEAKKAIRILGGEVVDLRQGNLTEFGLDHKILVIKKVKDTPAKYPRKAGIPSKEPLK